MRHKLKKPVLVSEIVRALGSDVLSQVGPDREVVGVSPFPNSDPGSLAFCNQKGWPDLECHAACLIVSGVEIGDNTYPTKIVVANPRLSFARAVAFLFKEEVRSGIHPTALVDQTSIVDPKAEIGAGVVIGPRCHVGEGTALGAGVRLVCDVRIGANTKVAANTVIGEEGFGFERDDDGRLVNMPHLGGVIIGDNVDIGANACIDRGTLHDTVVADGCRIDNLTHISHNVRMDRHAVVISNVTICGSVHLGERSWVAPNAVVKNQLKIGKDAVVGLGAVVVRDVADGETVAGNPAKPIRKQ
ncbi:MAG: UDP-3-O-(3-hydroxymyristoyl)glucosamine N-acyltransferase [Enhydrobacter sp.]|nr:MAG: UDP-3-O-(3-hydroxymyristoyl)glucosamine N-acyltransferase [Enhydrobacter sp.]